jgi:hypothetical protein
MGVDGLVLRLRLGHVGQHHAKGGKGYGPRQPVLTGLAERAFINEYGVVAFIISANILRRHLTAGQRAILGEELRPGLKAKAKEKQQVGKGADGSGLRGKKKNLHTNSYEGLSKPEHQEPLWVNAEIGRAVGVGAGTVATARMVKKRAPELADKVASGEMTLNAANTPSDLWVSAAQSTKILDW